jgi:hypothetical protein
MDSDDNAVHYIPRKVWANHSPSSTTIADMANAKVEELQSQGFLVLDARVWPEMVAGNQSRLIQWFSTISWAEPCPVCHETTHLDGPMKGSLPKFMNFLENLESRQFDDEDEDDDPQAQF